LLGVAFPPDYETSRYFFVYYNSLPNGDITIARYQAQVGNPNLADPASGRIMITFSKPFDNHNGGNLNFGPDGMLYIGTGDGGSGGDPNNLSQNGLSLLGKMLRININDSILFPYYSIPADNPYTANPAVDDRIWAIGLRNPWKWSFDKSTGDLWLADVGQGAWEEVNFRAAGSTGPINYGWRCYEGHAAFNTSGCLAPANYTFPIFDYPHNFATGGFSITGGYVFRGPGFPELVGYYICADYVSGNVWIIRPNGLGGWTSTIKTGMPGNISAFGEGEDGSLYPVSLNGTIYKIIRPLVLPVSLLSFSGDKQISYNELRWNTADEQDLSRFVIEYSLDGISWMSAGERSAINQAGNHQYSFSHFTSETAKLFYRLRIEDNAGRLTYSAIISLNGKAGSIRVYPTIIKDGIMRVNTEKPVTRIDILDTNGALVFSKQTGNQQGYFSVTLPVLGHGIYWARLQTSSGPEVVKLIIE
jgi:glucose/arabinose dehydrogenase